MSPENKRVAIAEACGWRIKRRDITGFNVWEPGSKLPAQLSNNLESKIPNYTGDLNELAAARDHLINTPELRIKWVNTLRDVVGLTCTRRNKAGQAQVSDIDLLFASPEQLCEAMVKTLNLWIK